MEHRLSRGGRKWPIHYRPDARQCLAVGVRLSIRESGIFSWILWSEGISFFQTKSAAKKNQVNIKFQILVKILTKILMKVSKSWQSCEELPDQNLRERGKMERKSRPEHQRRFWAAIAKCGYIFWACRKGEWCSSLRVKKEWNLRKKKPSSHIKQSPEVIASKYLPIRNQFTQQLKFQNKLALKKWKKEINQHRVCLKCRRKVRKNKGKKIHMWNITTTGQPLWGFALPGGSGTFHSHIGLKRSRAEIRARLKWSLSAKMQLPERPQRLLRSVSRGNDK